MQGRREYEIMLGNLTSKEVEMTECADKRY
jgi:hypothetical protein